MNPIPALPEKIIALNDDSLLPYLSAQRLSPLYAVIPAPSLGRIMGWPWWRALTYSLDAINIFDAEDAPALAAYALRAGQRLVICTTSTPQIETIQALAKECGGQILTKRPATFTLGRPPYNAYRIAQLKRYLAL